MLDRNPKTRLADVAEIKEHPWLREFEWEGIGNENGPVRVDQ